MGEDGGGEQQRAQHDHRALEAAVCHGAPAPGSSAGLPLQPAAARPGALSMLLASNMRHQRPAC